MDGPVVVLFPLGWPYRSRGSQFGEVRVRKLGDDAIPLPGPRR